MTVVGITEAEQHSIFKLVAAVLHLGQLKCEKKGEGSTVANKDELRITSDLLGITTEELEKTLCSKTVTRYNRTDLFFFVRMLTSFSVVLLVLPRVTCQCTSRH